MPTPVLIPLINPNEPEAFVADIYVSEDQRIEVGDLLCTLETTKSTVDLFAEDEGYLVGLRYKKGDTARAGEIFGYMASLPGWKPMIETPDLKSDSHLTPPPAGLRITEPALALARAKNLDLSVLPKEVLITESFIKEQISKTENLLLTAQNSLSHASFDAGAILIYGGGGHAKMVIDLLRAQGTYHLAGIVDDGLRPGELVTGVPILGGAGSLPGLQEQGVRLAANAVGGIGNIGVRIKIFQRLAEAGFSCPILVHPTAYLDPSARLTAGAQIFVHAYIGSEAQIGYGCIINTGAIISHDCILGDFVNISPGAILAGEVQIGSRALVGMGVTINLGVKVGPGARIGNGATVKADVPEGSIVRAGTIWPS